MTDGEGLPPLASLDDLRTRTGSTDDDDKLRLALVLASGRFRAQTGNPITRATETVTLDARGARTVPLPYPPVVDVSEVMLCGDVLDGDEWEWTPAGVLRFPRPLPDKWRSLTVTYTHGYDPVPDGIRDVILEQAAAVYNLLPGVMSYTTGGEARTYSSAMTVGTTAQWAAMVARYRLE